ncbi:MAG: hypothetical protein V1908_01465 [Candidatus Peregrinibacteria bacterium]
MYRDSRDSLNIELPTTPDGTSIHPINSRFVYRLPRDLIDLAEVVDGMRVLTRSVIERFGLCVVQEREATDLATFTRNNVRYIIYFQGLQCAKRGVQFVNLVNLSLKEEEEEGAKFVGMEANGDARYEYPGVVGGSSIPLTQVQIQPFLHDGKPTPESAFIQPCYFTISDVSTPAAPPAQR